MAAQCANLSVRQSSIGRIGMTAMPKACEGQVAGQTSGTANPGNQTLNMPYRVARRCGPWKVDLSLWVGLITNDNECSLARAGIEPRDKIGPKMSSVLIIERHVDNLSRLVVGDADDAG